MMLTMAITNPPNKYLGLMRSLGRLVFNVGDNEGDLG